MMRAAFFQPGRASASTAWLLLLAATALGCGRDAPEASAGAGGAGPRPPVVEALALAPRPFEDRVQLVGELRADESVVVKPEISGVIASVEFEEGEPVEAGQVLFRLRDGEQEARLDEALARLSLARDEHRRTKRLASQNAAAAAQLDRAKAELEVGRAQVELARVELERTRIRAPIDGYVGRRLVSPGAHVTPDTELVQVDAIDPLQALFTVPERAIGLARPEGRVEVEVAPFPDERFPGKVFFVAPSVDPRSRRLLLKARVPNPDGRLRPGLFAQVFLELGEREALLLPAEAVARDADGAYVWRLDEENRVDRVPVRLGATRDGWVEVETGLGPGDRVVTAGIHKLRAGMQVEASLRRETEAAAARGEGATLGNGG